MRIRLVAMAGLAVVAFAASGCDLVQRLTGGLSGPAITIGQPMQGMLEVSDRTDIFQDGSYTDLYQIDLTAGQQVTITMESQAFDTFLAVLRGRNEQLASNDDGIPGTTNSRIDFTAPSAGTYYLAATSLGTGIVGPYTLTVVPFGAPAAPVAMPQVPQPVAPVAPVAPAAGGDSCDAYQACCTALAGQPGMEAMAAGCAGIQALRSVPGGCDSTWQAMRAGMAANPSAPAACR